MSNVYRDAIEVLAERGWIQGKKETEDGVCLIGAIGAAKFGSASLIMYSDSVLDIPTFIAQEQFPNRFPFNSRELYDFNDFSATQIEDVIVVLEKSAVALEEQI